MMGLARSPQEAVILSVLLCGGLALCLGGALQWRRSPRILADLQIAAFFLLAYWLTYNRVPDFPPVGAINKLFYVAAVGTALGLLLEVLRASSWVRWLFLLFPVSTAAYIGQTRIAAAPLEVVLAAGFGALVFFLLIRDMSRSDGEANLRSAIALAVASAGFAPIALLGASSASLQLGLSFAVAISGIAFWHLLRPQFSFGAASLLGGAGGFVAAAQTVAMITRRIDFVALAILGMVFVVPLISERLNRHRAPTRPVHRTILFAAMCLVPALAAVVTALLRYEGSFPT